MQEANSMDTSHEIHRRFEALSSFIPALDIDIRLLVEEVFDVGNDVDYIVEMLGYHMINYPYLEGALRDIEDFVNDNPDITELELLDEILELFRRYL
ncbi:hypothetical protein FWF89_01925 [Candidatus Saccharibacteria bacterium]|nr:hypothetical protein [Candidatus Saccharibacteria bacterium]